MDAYLWVSLAGVVAAFVACAVSERREWKRKNAGQLAPVPVDPKDDSRD